jgi:hypothetical protein
LNRGAAKRRSLRIAIRRLARRRGLANRFSGVAKAMLPAVAVHALRRARGGSLSGAGGRVFDAPLLKRFSTRDLRYASTDLDRALDLMAICACD